MSKNAIIALTVVLCVLAAGVGAFFGMRGRTMPASAPAAQTAAAQPEAAPAASAAVEVAVPVTSPAQTPTAEAASPSPVATSPVTVAPSAPAATSSAPKRAPEAARAPAAAASSTKPAPASQTAAAPDPARPVTPPASQAAAEQAIAVAPSAEQKVAEAPVAAPPAAEPVAQFDELVVEADAVVGVKLDSSVNSETARVEDPVEAHVSRDVRVGSRVAIPSGARVLGVVTQADRGGKMKSRARLAVRFHTLVLPDGTRTTIQTDAVLREGDAPGQEAASKMGAAAAGGAILGAILGGGKGAAIGGSIGAAGGAAAVMNGDRSLATLQAGTSLTLRLLRPVTVIVAR
jgi:type IV secretory pathway VirB10-like protein